MAEAVDALWERATLLAAHGKPELAEQLLRRLLEVDSEHAPGHALLAQLAADASRVDEALDLARRAIALEPELAYAHHGLAYVHWVREEYEAALKAALEACRLGSFEPNHHALAAQVLVAEKRWKDALAHTECGLELDASHVACLNLRALALRNLGRGDEARATVESALAEDPENAYTHLNQGWALLQQGDAKRAIAHFQESLRHDPSLDEARAGLVEALKARNPFYRLVLGWFLWLGRYTAARQRQILLGLFVASICGRNLLKTAGHPEAAEWVGYTWLGFVMATSCAVPFFNFLLLLHPIGRRALDPAARRNAILLGCAALACIGIAISDWVSPSKATEWGTWLCLVFLFPVAGLGTVREGWPLRVLQVFCAAGAAYVGWWIVRALAIESEFRVAPSSQRSDLRQDMSRHMEWFFHGLWSFVLSSWYVMLLSGRRRRR